MRYLRSPYSLLRVFSETDSLKYDFIDYEHFFANLKNMRFQIEELFMAGVTW